MFGLMDQQQAAIDAREAADVALVDDGGQLLLRVTLLQMYLWREEDEEISKGEYRGVSICSIYPICCALYGTKVAVWTRIALGLPMGGKMTPEGVVVVRLVLALLALEALVRLVAAHVQLQAALRAEDALQKRREEN